LKAGWLLKAVVPEMTAARKTNRFIGGFSKGMRDTGFLEV